MNSENILNLFYKKKYIVECVITLDSIQYFNLATIQKGRRNSNSSINVRSKINSDELAKLIEKGKAIHLLISGDVILHKVFEKSKLEEVENPVHLFFPTESEINFGVQLTEFPVLGKINLCLIRNGYLNQLNEFFLSHTIFVESCSLGPFGIEPFLAPEINSASQLAIENYLCALEKGIIIDFEYDSPTLIGQNSDLNLSKNEAQMVLLKAKMINNSITFPTVDSSIFKTNSESVIKISKSLKTFKYHALVMLLLILSTSIYMNDLKKKSNIYRVFYLQNEGQYALLDSLSAQESYLNRIKDSSEFSKILPFHYLSDELTHALPDGMLLSELTIQPPSSNFNESVLQFERNSVIVKGISSNSYVLNSWIRELKKEKWLNDISVLNYINNPEKDLDHFAIQIKF